MSGFVPIDVGVWASRFDLTGHRCTVNDLAELLKKVPRSLATTCITSLCNLLVEEELSSAFEVDRIARITLLGSEIRDALKRFESGKPRVIAFHRSQLLLGLQLVQRLCVEDETGVLDRPGALPFLGEALLGVSEFLDRGVPEKIKNADLKSSAAALLPMYERSNSPKVRLALRRTYEMLANPMWHEDEDLAEAARRFTAQIGVSPKDYILVVFGLVVKVMGRRGFGPDKGIRMNTVFRLARDRDSIRRIVEGLSIGYRDLPTVIAAPEEVLREIPLEPFRSRPLIALSHDQFWCVDLSLLTQRMLSGLFWTLMDFTPVDQRGILIAAWGRLFEKYMTNRFAPTFGKRYRADPRDRFGNQVTDGIVVCKPDLILLEFKAPFLRDDVKRRLEFDPLAEEFVRKFLVNGQLGRAAERICCEEELQSSLKLGRRAETIYPVIVSLDFAAGAPLLAQAMTEPFREMTAAIQLNGSRLAALSILTADDAETILPFVQSGKKLKNILRESLEENPVRQPTFQNYLAGLANRMEISTSEKLADNFWEPFEAAKAFWQSQATEDLLATM